MNMVRDEAQIAILGGGLVGRLLAWQLVQAGISTALFDKGLRDGSEAAAFVAAAMLAPQAESVEATPLVTRLGRQSILLWRDILSRLSKPVFMQQNGSLIVWHHQDKPLATQFKQHLQRADGGELTAWQAAQIGEHEPQLAGRFQTGFYLPGEGQLDGRQVLEALACALEESGVACHWHTESDVSALRQRFGWVIDCRGFGAQNEWNRRHDAGGSRLRGVRGEVVRAYAPEVTLNRPVRLLHPRYPLYIAPKENHVFVIGATQLESESRAPASVRSGLELLSALYAVHPAFGEAQVLEIATNLRPTLNHHNPEIRYSLAERVVEVNGLFRHGFMISPSVTAAAARLMAILLAGKSVPPGDEASGMAYVDNGMPV
ncbi:MAG: FAD-dependent oxidoreductase [Neisseria sp.]|uniref:FAD-dependent oxidoreductase n=1 Tax=Neisseria sp. TaxID=192066 RepID=UPI0026DBC1B7|nr:FAD-dependent oxidoreductase [Neisseria sp.]MDO4641962.1 FAD-dependent oxidoreductase [Neisseria sp.]